MTDVIVASPIASALGLTLLQFVWQGALIGLVTGMVLAALRHRSANARYLAACVGMTVMLATPIATWTTSRAETGGPIAAVTPGASVASPIDRHAGLGQNAEPARSAADPMHWPAPHLTTLVPFVVMAWMVGVLVLSVRLLSSWFAIEALRRRTTRPLPEPWRLRTIAMAHRLGVTRQVRTAASALLEVPTVIGWLRPMILVPTSVLAGLPALQLEAILAHELAHVRRHDYLVNIAQRITETLLFYHPAVWWMSQRIRTERELCCDDLAVQMCGDRLTYAAALVSLEELRPAAPALALALAATGGSLLMRIHRVLGTEPRRLTQPFPLSAALVILFIAVLPLAGARRVDAAPTVATAIVARADIALEARGIPAAASVTPQAPVGSQPQATTVPTIQSSTNQLPPVTIEELLSLWEAGDRRPRVVRYDERGLAALRSGSASAGGRGQSTSTFGVGAVRPGSGISNPIPLVRPTPIYTQAALDQKIMGTVEVELVVQKDGTVGDVRVVRSIDREFGMDDAALAAAKKWLFKPGMDRNGQPVAVIVTLIFDLRLH